ncbi:MAG TPA: hypothetical protein VFL51_04615 [Pseudolabrys sp.]|nr:hypothetical protein [Pseudolabrys sp.]
MKKLIPLAIATIAFAGMSVALSDSAYAAKKAKHLTYDEAWAKCKAELDKYRGDTTQKNTRGASCMHRYGYRI